MIVECPAVDLKGSDDGQITLDQFMCEPMLFDDPLVRPTQRAIELHHDECAIFRTELIDPVLVAIQGQYSPVAAKANALDRLEDDVGSKLCVG